MYQNQSNPGKGIVIGVLIAIALALGIMLSSLLLGKNESQNFQVLQNLNGKVTIRSQGGWYTHFFNTIWTYDKVRTIYYSDKKDESNDNDPLEVQFKNKGKGKVSVQVVARLYENELSANTLHTYARGDMDTIDMLIQSRLRNIARAEAAKIGSNDAIENYAIFADGISKQIVGDPELKQKGIFIETFQITNIEFDENTAKQFAEQQSIELERKKAEANLVKFKAQQDEAVANYAMQAASARGMAEAQMAKDVTEAERTAKLATIKAQQQVDVETLAKKEAEIKAAKDKEIANILATQKKEVAALDLEAAALDAKSTIVKAEAKKQELELAKGLSELEKFLIENETQVRIETAKAMSSGLSQVKLPATMFIGGSGEGKQMGFNPVENILNLMTIEKVDLLNKEHANTNATKTTTK